MIMGTNPSVLAAAQRTTGHPWASGLAAILKRWWLAYATWRVERAAIAQLQSMSDMELKDIGLTRSDITGAVRGEAARDRAFSRHY
jgi:uncharacterized protein YjiS (DUF1127 family)